VPFAIDIAMIISNNIFHKMLYQCISLTKPVCLTNVTCAYLKINGGSWLKLYSIVRFIPWIDLFLYISIHYVYERVTAGLAGAVTEVKLCKYHRSLWCHYIVTHVYKSKHLSASWRNLKCKSN